MPFIKTSRSLIHPDLGMVHPVPSEITPRQVYEGRRAWLQQAGLAALTSASWVGGSQAQGSEPLARRPGKLAPLPGARSAVPGSVVMDKLTPYEDVTTYNNFYEFGTDKGDPADLAHTLKTRPWSLSIEGEVGKPLKLGLDDLLKLGAMEERIYRLRCVEGWSMVIPWVGYSLSTLIKRAEPTSRAKFVEFVSLADPKQMPGVRSSVLDWPYVEGLRIDEAMHPLTLMAFGLYGEVLPNQNGAPLRLVVPWKYGFKSAKSIVRIRLVEREPVSSWTRANPREYGFYSNVNPGVDHPRWSQASERRIGEGGLFTPRKPTLMFNGYQSQVASLYAGMDLKKYY
ncbi:MAG TPA: protein-methionine-sulfoxide reductase catalytic subunit MsrP [Aquabacterium sp.]|uniref:protein-methionine-sulfoxide reductase catalytic subunit MsrP n=1 Tax=Aquabacterium sp. TaxID=1872578 RepID=UPI002E36A12B|nr:protein-methionine-sulfoxide reductase catalytic subunit MsrP [Aquabacterium sp.]HEX5372452.1 protein-methionine-sulfoxide reductase catalytic subunit MsrP [Aquabacterium sp.]